MAGRGTDIKLGEGVADIGGLYVIATERHQSRRIDRQLRGRCARQGDPGESIFFISFEDDLMRNFGASERMTKMMERFGLEEGQELEHPWLNKSVETAQKRVEQRNYMIRKRVLEYDDVMNQQREVVYGYRSEVLQSKDPRALINEVIEESIPARVEEFLMDPLAEVEGPNYEALLQWINTTFPLRLSREDGGFEDRDVEENGAFLVEKVSRAYELKTRHEDQDALKGLERYVILNAIDRLWQEHLYSMDALREGVNLRTHGQKDPLVEYKVDAYAMFVELMDNIKGEILNNLFRSTTNLQAFENFLRNLPRQLSRDELESPTGAGPQSTGPGAAPAGLPGQAGGPQITMPQTTPDVPKVGRNAPCPCGSGKKFKQCCGRTA
ncbi:MAG: SEC-C metal-binding domain-containing protein, partial [Verrucomicrobiales bacterium]